MLRAVCLCMTLIWLCLCPPEGASAQQPSTATRPPRAAYIPTGPSEQQRSTSTGSGEFTLHQTSRLVLLDIVVTDSAGHIVTGLHKQDFQVMEDKQPQTILHFETSADVTPNPDETIDSTATLDAVAPRAPVTIIVLDEFNTRFEDMAFARYSLKKYLDKQPRKLSTPTMLIAVAIQKFTVLQDYTQNKKALLDALDHSMAVNPWQLGLIDWVPDRFAMAFATLMRVAEASEGHAGHKNMIWIGRGFPAMDYSLVPIDAINRVNTLVQECVNMLRDARITLYTVDPAGVLVNPAQYGPEGAFSDPFGGNYEFSLLAKATGGRALYGRNDVDAEIGTTIRDGRDFYTLAYRPTNGSQNPEKFRKIRVTLDRAGLTATTREGYYVQTPPALVSHEKPSSRIKFDLLSASDSRLVYDAVPISVSTNPRDSKEFSVHIDPKALVWTYAQNGKPRGTQVVLLVSTFDRKDTELSRDAKLIRVNAPLDVAPTGPLERGLILQYAVSPNPKAVRVRFVVRVSATGRVGTADAALQAESSASPPTHPAVAP
jgi:VWFA-related protein